MRPVVAALCLAALLMAPAAAVADDQSVWDSYAHAHRAELGRAVDAYDKASRQDRVRVVITAGRRVSRTLARIAADVRGETSSSPAGEEAKGLLLDSLAAWRQGMAYDRRSLRALRSGRLARSTAAGIRSHRALARSDRLEARAVDALRSAGVKL
jgi:hypothetical protein